MKKTIKKIILSASALAFSIIPLTKNLKAETTEEPPFEVPIIQNRENLIYNWHTDRKSVV